MPRTKTRMADVNKLTVTHTDANGKIIEDLSKVNLAKVDPELNNFVAKIYAGVVKC